MRKHFVLGGKGKRMSDGKVEAIVTSAGKVSAVKFVPEPYEVHFVPQEKAMAEAAKISDQNAELLNRLGGLKPDVVNSPAHYTAYPVEVIQLTEHMNFNRGNAVKYIARAGLKNPDKELEDLQKAAWYIDREINRIKGENKQ